MFYAANYSGLDKPLLIEADPLGIIEAAHHEHNSFLIDFQLFSFELETGGHDHCDQIAILFVLYLAI